MKKTVKKTATIKSGSKRGRPKNKPAITLKDMMAMDGDYNDDLGKAMEENYSWSGPTAQDVEGLSYEVLADAWSKAAATIGTMRPEPDYRSIALELASTLEDIQIFNDAMGGDPASGALDFSNFIFKRAKILNKYFDHDDESDLVFKTNN